MKQYILLLVLMVMGAGIHAYAEDVNPVKEGNVISGHVVEKGTENIRGEKRCVSKFGRSEKS